MYRRDFEMLPDYTGSEPTGKYNGKMWKAQYDSCGNRKWYLCWCHDENTVSQEIYILSLIHIYKKFSISGLNRYKVSETEEETEILEEVEEMAFEGYSNPVQRSYVKGLSERF